MHWQDDTEVGGWIRDRLDPSFATIHGVVPRGFEAYARVFHPASVRSVRGRAVPTTEEWRAFSEEEHERIRDLIVDEQTTWAATATAFGTTMHPLAQWNGIVRRPELGSWDRARTADGREFSAPNVGDLPPETLASVAEHLVAHTTTPDDGVAGVWEGWGRPVHVFFRAVGDSTDESALAAKAAASAPSDDPFTLQPDSALAGQLSEGARLELPQRDHMLFAAPPRAFTDPDWVLHAPWRDRALQEQGLRPIVHHPSLIWPADRAWILVSEIDFDSTIVGGSAELVADLCDDARIEALPIPEGADLHWDADHLND